MFALSLHRIVSAQTSALIGAKRALLLQQMLTDVC
jgi:hypothetical protein